MALPMLTERGRHWARKLGEEGGGGGGGGQVRPDTGVVHFSFRWTSTGFLPLNDFSTAIY